MIVCASRLCETLWELKAIKMVFVSGIAAVCECENWTTCTFADLSG